MIPNILTLAQHVHDNNKAKGFYDNPPEVYTQRVLMISELYEAFEALRKDRFTDKNQLLFDLQMIRDNKIAIAKEHLFLSVVKDTFEDEIADFVIRILDWIGYNSGGLNEFPIYDGIRSISHGMKMNGVLQIENDSECFCITLAVIQELLNEVAIKTPSDVCIRTIGQIIAICFMIADRFDFDLNLHIRLKIEYNKTRPYKHGKKF